MPNGVGVSEVTIYALPQRLAAVRGLRRQHRDFRVAGLCLAMQAGLLSTRGRRLIES